jgi:hypothetical protein
LVLWITAPSSEGRGNTGPRPSREAAAAGGPKVADLWKGLFTSVTPFHVADADDCRQSAPLGRASTSVLWVQEGNKSLRNRFVDDGGVFIPQHLTEPGHSGPLEFRIRGLMTAPTATAWRRCQGEGALRLSCFLIHRRLDPF